MCFKPQYYTLVSGVGKSKFSLSAFDNALRDAGIGDYNLVKVSSILPSNCEFCEQIPIGKGEIIYVAYATITVTDNEEGQTAVAVAIPVSDEDSGVIFETSSINSKQDTTEIVKKMCIEAMESRNKLFHTILHSSQKIVGENDYYTAAISAVVMW